MNGQIGWVAQDAAVQNETTFHGSSRAAAITDKDGYLKHTFQDGRTRVWTDMRLRVAHSALTPVPDADATAAVYVFTNGQVMVFDGKQPKASGVTASAGEWTRFTIFSDYAAKQWVLHVNDVHAGRYGFFNPAVASYGEYLLKGGATHVDDVGITTGRPAMSGVATLLMVR